MLKASQKSKYNKGLIKPPARVITTHHQWEDQTFRKADLRPILDTSLKLNKYVGYFRLNREHRYNTLTSNYIASIKRGLLSLDREELVKAIVMHPLNGEHFSNGTDFRTILHFKKKGEFEGITSYLTDLYSLQTLTAKINKPVIGVGPGHQFNSGAAWFQSIGCPAVTHKSKISFNDCTFGFVPHGGSSYYLSRMPGELGTFLALTGLPLNGIDAMETGLADKIVTDINHFCEHTSEAVDSLDWPMFTAYHTTDKYRKNDWKAQIQHRNNLIEGDYHTDYTAMLRQKHENYYAEEFFEPNARRPSVTAKSEHYYKTEIKKYNQLRVDEAEAGYLDNQNNNFVNYYAIIMNKIKSATDIKYSKEFSILKHMQAINRCFYPSTVEEIVENLKRENTPFAKLCLDRMNENSMLSMKLTLQMLRKARSLDYKACLQQEINVALNKIQDAEFDSGVGEVLMKPGRSGQPEFKKQIPDEQVQSFFDKNKWADQVQLDVVEKALLPTRFYYEKFSDQVRLWINEESTPQIEVRHSFQYEVKEALRHHGIDIRDRALTIESARAQLFAAEMENKKAQVLQDRIHQISTDDTLRNRYFDQVREQIDQWEQNTEAFYQRVNDSVQKVFQSAYFERLQQIYDKSKEAHGLEKRRMFIKFKKFLYQNRIMQYQNDEMDRNIQQINAMPFKEIHLTENWEQSYRDLQHPELHRSVLYHLSKVVGKSSIAPRELAQQFMSQPELRDKLTVFTFDKEELLKLRRDILENPDKYTQILSHDTGFYNMAERDQEKRLKNEEYVYWYRILNDGRCPMLDNLPNYERYVAFKDFVDNVEKRSIETLRLIVQRLINDFEKDEQTNEIKNFEQKEKETKHKAMTRLLETVYEYEGKPNPKKAKNNKETQLISKERSLNDVKRIINNLVENDPHISKVIPKGDQSNPLIREVKEKIVNELYKNIEFALLNTNETANIPKNVIQERLAEIINPQNVGGNKVNAQLKVIDAYLNEANAEQVIKQAIQKVKPYYLLQMRHDLLEEGQKLMDLFRSEQTGMIALFYYMMNMSHPELIKSPIVDRILNFSFERDYHKFADQLKPDESIRFAIKNFISMIGYGQEQQLSQAKSLSEKEKILEQKVKQDIQNIEDLKQEVRQSEEKYLQEALQRSEENLKRPFDIEDPEREIDENPVLRVGNFTHAELDQILEYTNAADRIWDYIDSNAPIIKESLKPQDWLHIYGSIIKDYGLDPRALFKFGLQEEDYEDFDFLQEFQNQYKGNQNLTWTSFGEYLDYLGEVFDSQVKACAEPGALKNYEQTLELYFKHRQSKKDPKDLLRDQSIFQTLVADQKQGELGANIKPYNIREELRDFTSLQKRVGEASKLKETIRSLSLNAPKEIRDKIIDVIQSNSTYLNLKQIEQLLLNQKYDEILKPVNLIDKELLLSDIKSNKNNNFQLFLKNYESLPLDVVSLAEARETVAAMKSHELVDHKFRNQILLVLDYASDSLAFVAPEMRRSMTLGDFMHRHPFLNRNSIQSFASDVLKTRLENTLGELANIDLVDWQLGFTRTNPAAHSELDEAIQTAHEIGKHVNVPQSANKQYNDLDPRYQDNYGPSTIVTPDENGRYVIEDRYTHEYQKVMEDAQKLTLMRSDFTHVKNYYENQVMKVYADPEFDQSELERLVSEYTNLRLKECLLTDEFAQKLKSGNGHIYLKVLREHIQDELKLTQEVDLKDFSLEKMEGIDTIFVDVEGKYNFSDINNQNAVGYNNIEQRAQNQQDQKKNRDLAHETMFDKLVSEYFLNKRAQYANTQEMMDQLAELMDKREPEDGYHYKSGNRKQKKMNQFPAYKTAPVAYQKALNEIEKNDAAYVLPQDFTEMMDLDIATAHALQNSKNGLSLELRHAADTEIPEYFDLYDVRKPPAKWVEDQLDLMIHQIFSVRRKIEKSLSRNELIAYDKVLIKHLEKDKLIPKLRDKVQEQYNSMHQMKQVLEMHAEGQEENEFRQFAKEPNNQAEENKQIKNEDGFYKYVAYAGMLEKKRRENLALTRSDDIYAKGIHSFERYYLDELQTDLKRPPQPINEERFKPKERPIPNEKLSEGFKTLEEKQQEYFADFEKYNENKKEQIERMQLFFVLEQFFSQTKNTQEPLSKAQEAIVEYFKDTENTQFFDKNKIQ